MKENDNMLKEIKKKDDSTITTVITTADTKKVIDPKTNDTDKINSSQTNTIDVNVNDNSMDKKQVHENEDKGDKPKKNKKPRCHFNGCKKKLKMQGFKCKCGYEFCAKHRLDFTHDCTYDFQKEAGERLKKNLVILESTKLNKI